MPSALLLPQEAAVLKSWDEKARSSLWIVKPPNRSIQGGSHVLYLLFSNNGNGIRVMFGDQVMATVRKGEEYIVSRNILL